MAILDISAVARVNEALNPLTRPLAAGELIDRREVFQSLATITEGLERAAPGHSHLRGPLRALRRIEYRLSRPPLLVILGETNAGKSSLGNLMLGQTILPTGMSSTTHAPIRVFHADYPITITANHQGHERIIPNQELQVKNPEIAHVKLGLPNQWLEHYEVFDTPGLDESLHGLVQRVLSARHTVVTIWCTPATQAWKDSERLSWERLPRRLRTNAILAVTRKDAFKYNHERIKVQRRLEMETSDYFRAALMLSNTQATRALTKNGQIADPIVWNESGANSFITAVRQTITRVSQERLAVARGTIWRITIEALNRLTRRG